MLNRSEEKGKSTTVAEGRRENTANQSNEGSDHSSFAVPSISLPKGGGAIRGMGEKFAANPVTGTGSMSVPIAVSPGRSGFGPQLSLSYDSGSGNGPFGLGWNLSLPSITRKTDKGLPRYFDAEESDVFLLSGAEDLVPVLDSNNKRLVIPRTIGTDNYDVHLYRPRIEGLFARIERWTRLSDGDTHWRSITKDNITTFYGKTEEARIFDPEDKLRVFTWLICESYDDKGNAILYGYEEEDSTGIDLTQVNEKNRTEDTRKSNRYLKRIKYGNRQSRLMLPDLTHEEWLFEVVFDYGEHEANNPAPNDPGNWLRRPDPFSSYRSGFEVRTYRLCQRVLMFHRFAELGATPYLVRSTDFKYNPTPISSFITSVTQSGYVRQSDGTYLKKSLPPVEFTYTEAVIENQVRELDAESLDNLPTGLDGSNYQWIDLDGDGVAGILTEQANAWFYKRNISPKPEKGVARTVAKFVPVETVAVQPSFRGISGGGMQFLDLAGDGRPDLVQFDGPAPGFYEHEEDGEWTPHRPFTSLPNVNWSDPNLKFIDLTGDGHSDILISENDVFTWYPSLAEAGFGASELTRQPFDEEKGPRLVFADGTQSIYQADFSGDGLTDIVRIRNGEVCYWPNLGYGRFGAKVTMDNAPWFDHPDQFDQRRIRLADIDGSGVTDIIYLHSEGVRLYFNQSGNSWSEAKHLNVFPQTDNLSSVAAVDLLGNGTACLVWSSPLPGHARRQMCYVDLMGGQKPHLMISSKNNLGAETHVHYAPSTKFYLEDKYAGKPWISRLSFPVHCVERVETYDRVSGNRFVTRYAYHHGYFDGVEREFRGFGMVEQWDTEEIGSIPDVETSSIATNLDKASFVPPIHTKTWFHTGVYLGRDRVSNYFAGLLDDRDIGEYYREPGLTDVEAKKLLLDDTVLPADWTLDEERQACRALKSSMLRQEVYAKDAPDDATEEVIERAKIPYTVTEQNFAIKCLQPQGPNRHAVFFTHACESISYHYERTLFPVVNEEIVDDVTASTGPNVQWLPDPRIAHMLTLEVDNFGNVLKSAAVGYGRRYSDLRLSSQRDHNKQKDILITYTENRFTRCHDTDEEAIDKDDDYRTPLLCESRTYDLSGLPLPAGKNRFTFDDVLNAGTSAEALDYEEAPTAGSEQKRLIEHIRTVYRSNDLTELLPLGQLESLALPGDSYKLAFTPRLLTQVYKRKLGAGPEENLLPDPDLAQVLGGKGQDQGGYVDLDGRWWIPSGRIFYSKTADTSNPAATAAVELMEARQNFFLPKKFTNPFEYRSTVDYDTNNLFVVGTVDAVNNKVTALYDYRVLQPKQITDPNSNRSEAMFDALGLVVGTAVIGKNGEGDSFATFTADLTSQQIKDYFDPEENPRPLAIDHLGTATTRFIYDLERIPACAASIVRETHFIDLDQAQNEQTKVQLSFVYSDGFGRVAQAKIQAEPGPIDPNDPASPILDPRWVGTGAVIYNNKGKPVRQYEPFFSPTHQFGIEQHGVSRTLFYDPAERVVATLHPNHIWEKVVFDPWQQTTFDVNDTVLNANNSTDPKSDKDVGGYFARLPDADYLPTWYERRITLAEDDPERVAADKAAVHRQTPTVAHLDTLGRVFLTIAHNRFEQGGAIVEEKYPTRVELDIEGNQREVIDAKDRVVMRYDYDMLGNRIHQSSMDAGERWMLNDVTGKVIRAWDTPPEGGHPGHTFRTVYDELRRPIRSFVKGSIGNDPSREVLYQLVMYGEKHPRAEALNLRTRVFLQFDGAGMVRNGNAVVPVNGQEEAYDFKGNLLRSSRRLAKDYKNTPDWKSLEPLFQPATLDLTTIENGTAPLLEAEFFEGSTRFDALNRPIQVVAPRSNLPNKKCNVVRPGYNEANLLERMDVWLERANEPNALLDRTTAEARTGVSNIDYDAKGQRRQIEYKNGVNTSYTYEKETFRLTHLETLRGAERLQDLQYNYDPVGNITHIRDDAQQTIIFGNQLVEPHNDYTYDAIYRLIKATGREHLGQTANPPTPYDEFNFFHIRRDPNDPNLMGRYDEEYSYDEVGNILFVRHRGTDPQSPGWKRCYQYAENSNRLLSTSNPKTLHDPDDACSPHYAAAPVLTETYGYDTHGCMISMPHLSAMGWDFHDQLRNVDLGGGGNAFYVYDASGQRTRKVWEKNGQVDERIYLGSFEVLRSGNGIGGTVTLERETLHIMDDKQRIALIETRTQGNDGSPALLIRYQFSNHLGSASLESDERAQIISYEEYTPYGSTSYQAVDSQTETPKRYRYTGKERDEESGLYYHGARYYASSIARWICCDPAGLIDTKNLYLYSRCNPVTFIDINGLQASMGPFGPFKAMHQLNQVVKEVNALPGKALAAVGEWVEEHPRIMGAVKALGGAGEVVAGGAAVLMPEPTMLTKAVGGLAIAHGVDTMQAGVRQVDTGEKTSTLTSAAIETVAVEAGVDPEKARVGAELSDATIGLGLSLGAGALSSTSNATKVMAAQGKAAEAAQEGSAIAKVQSLWLRGAELDEAWLASSTADKFFYEIGQKTLNAENWAKFGDITDPIERGKAIWEAQGYGALLNEGHGWVGGLGKTFSTGPTPAARLAAEKGGASIAVTGQLPKAGEAISPQDRKQ